MIKEVVYVNFSESQTVKSLSDQKNSKAFEPRFGLFTLECQNCRKLQIERTIDLQLINNNLLILGHSLSQNFNPSSYTITRMKRYVKYHILD